MTRADDVETFRNLLTAATQLVDAEYFLLPVADQNGGEPIIQYRERVYSYELYHQLRVKWPHWDYSLGGEVDKRKHPVIHGQGLDNAKPDLLIHVPGTMHRNLVVVEIKALSPNPSNRERALIHDDLKKLRAFCDRAAYEAGFLLVFGEDVNRIIGHVNAATAEGLNLNRIELWHHREPGEAAYRVAL
jgi:hypothetical protein